MNNKEIGQRIRSARMMRGLTQENLGNLLKISAQAVQKIESGCNQVNVEYLEIISNHLNVSVDYLVKGVKRTENDIELSFETLSGEKKLYVLLRLLTYCCKIDNYKYKALINKILNEFHEEEE